MANLEDLEKRIAKLEEQNKDNLKMFGRSYSQYGNSNSDFLIKTKGQVKIQWGSKFIDLIKDGKINVESDFIYSVDSTDDIGVKDGIYIIDEGKSVILQLNSKQYPIIGEIGTTYVSFVENQETNSDAKHNALVNIGFIHESLDTVDSNSLQNGIIYVESTQKLYTITNGNLSEFSINIPNPFTQQFIIAKNDSNEGALVIEGDGINNSLAFNTLHIYSESGTSYIDSSGNVSFIIGQSQKINVTDNYISFNDTVQADEIQSKGASFTNGYRLYILGGQSTLEVDNLIVRNGLDIDVVNKESKYNSYWISNKNNVISNVKIVTDDDYPVLNMTAKNEQSIAENTPIVYNAFEIHLKYENKYSVGNLLMLYMDLEDDIVECPCIVRVSESSYIVVEFAAGYATSTCDVNNIVDEYSNLVGRTIFYISNLVDNSQEMIYKVSNNGLNILSLESKETTRKMFDATSPQSGIVYKTHSKFGNLKDLSLLKIINDDECEITGDGLYSEQIYCKEGAYTNETTLNVSDYSSKFATTKWVTDYLDDNIESKVNKILENNGLI